MQAASVGMDAVGLPEYRHTLGWPEYRPHGQDAHATRGTMEAAFSLWDASGSSALTRVRVLRSNGKGLETP